MFIDFYPQYSIILFICSFLFAIIGLILIPKSREHLTITLSKCLSVYSFVYILLLYKAFDKSKIGFQFCEEVNIIKSYNIFFSVGIDGISLSFLILTAFIMPLCIFASESINKFTREFVIYLLIIEFLLLLTFFTTDLFFFFVFFESVLIPMFILIGIWGARPRKIRAAYIFFLYTLFGSFFMLYGIFYLYTTINSTNFDTLLYVFLTKEEQIFLWICFFIPFAIKIPMVPFHIWLPEAHVEAPTIGSVILASLLLKLGGYGLLRFVIPMFPLGTCYFLPLLQILGIISVVYASLATIRQSDIKRIIAYSSIAHMNLIVLGIFGGTFQGLDGSVYLMIGHGVVSSGLFFCVGVLYDRYHTRLLRYYSGLVQMMPIFTIFFFSFSLANMSFPSTSNFVGEFLIFNGLFSSSPWVTILSATSIVWSAIYSIWLFNRVLFGSLSIVKIKNYFPIFSDSDKNKLKYTTNIDPIKLRDLNRNETLIFAVLAFSMILLGCNSSIVTSLTHVSIYTIENIVTEKLAY